MLVSDSKDGPEEPHRSDRTGREGALEGLRYMLGGILCILAEKVLQSQWIRRGAKEPSSAKQESGRIWVFRCSYNRAGGGAKKGTSASSVLVLVYWIWLWLVGKSGARGGKGRSLSCRGVEDEQGPYKVFVLTAVMHGVAGDNHRWGHGNGGAAHAKLIGDGIICTTAARLASSGSWKEENQCCKIISDQTVGSKKYQKWITKIILNCSLVFLKIAAQNKH